MVRARLGWLFVCLMLVAVSASFSEEPEELPPNASAAQNAPEVSAPPVAPPAFNLKQDTVSEAVLAEERILKAQEQKLTFEATDTTLTEFLGMLRKQLQIPIDLDTTSLEDEGVAPDVAIFVPEQHRTAQAILERALEPHQLSWVIRHEALLITTRVAIAGLYDTRVYNIVDLIAIVPPKEAAVKEDELSPGQQLIELILDKTGGRETGPWDSIHSEGASDPVIFTTRGTTSLVVRQTRAVHREIEQLLNDLSLSVAVQAGKAEEGPPPSRRIRAIPQRRGRLLERP